MWIAAGTLGLTAAGLLAYHLNKRSNVAAAQELASANERAETATRTGLEADAALRDVTAGWNEKVQAHDNAKAAADAVAGADVAQRRLYMLALGTATAARVTAEREEATAELARSERLATLWNEAELEAAAQPPTATKAAEAAAKETRAAVDARKKAAERIASAMEAEAQASTRTHTQEKTANAEQKAKKELDAWSLARSKAAKASVLAEFAKTTADDANAAMGLKAKTAQELAIAKAEAKSAAEARAKGPNSAAGQDSEALQTAVTTSAAKVAAAKTAATEAAGAARAATSEADASQGQAKTALEAAAKALKIAKGEFRDASSPGFGFAGRSFTGAHRGRLASYV
jgi:hypothetical protein